MSDYSAPDDGHSGFTNNWLNSRHPDQLFKYRYPDFKLYDEPVNRPNTMYRDILKTLERSPVSDLFFSDLNLRHLKHLIARLVKSNGGYIITPESQSDNELFTIMRSIYLQYSRNLPTDRDQQVADLNLKVLVDVVPRVITKINMELTYQRDAGSMPLPLERSQYVSSAGTRSNRSVTDIFM